MNDQSGLGGLIVDVADDAEPMLEHDGAGRLISVTHADGSVEIYLNPQLPADKNADDPHDHHANLAETIPADELNRIGLDLVDKILADATARKARDDMMAEALAKLGLKREDVSPGGNVSKLRHPALLEAVIRFQANASAELLPADGPCKVRVDDSTPETGEAEMADRLAADINAYLTRVATEYYPDTERMLFQVALYGLGVKKVYRCPLRGRIVAEQTPEDKVIVAPDAVSLESAPRVTLEFDASPDLVKRMQYVKAWRQVDLGPAYGAVVSAVDAEKSETTGVDKEPESRIEEERPHPLYETYCMLDLPGFEHKDDDGQPTGIAMPYRVTLHQKDGTILEIRRMWAEDDDRPIPMMEMPLVDYQYVPWSGFYPLGLTHIIGGTNDALTAAWRLLMDLGMFANFPGTLHLDFAGRQDSMDLRVQPGESRGVKAPPNMSIRDAIMPLPYTMQHAPALMQFQENVAQYAQRLANTAEIAVGEGRQDAPVGTTMALLEQAVKVLLSVHKRLHRAQARELQLIVRLIKQAPQEFIDSLGKSAVKQKAQTQWDVATLRAALDNEDIVPQSDPNTASHTQRLMRVAAVKQLQAQNPDLYDTRKVDEMALRMIGVENPMELFAKMPPAGAGNPMLEATAKAKVMDAETRRMALEFKEREAKANVIGENAERELALQKSRMSLVAEMLKNPQAAAAFDHLLMQVMAQSGVAQQVAPDVPPPMAQ